MKTDRRKFISTSLLTAGAFSITGLAQDGTRSIEEAPTIGLRGRVCCLTEELQNIHRIIPDCKNRGHVYSLKSSDGKFYPFLPTDSSAAIWMDERYRQRDLQVTVRLFPETRFIEVIKLQSRLNGRLHDLYYYCDVCMIAAHKPGPCECCQDPLQFRETLAE